MSFVDVRNRVEWWFGHAPFKNLTRRKKNMDTIGYDWGEFDKRIGIQQPKGIVVLKSGSIMFFHIFSTCVFFMLTRGQP